MDVHTSNDAHHVFRAWFRSREWTYGFPVRMSAQDSFQLSAILKQFNKAPRVVIQWWLYDELQQSARATSAHRSRAGQAVNRHGFCGRMGIAGHQKCRMKCTREINSQVLSNIDASTAHMCSLAVSSFLWNAALAWDGVPMGLLHLSTNSHAFT
jgi:hypothetical protein